MKPKNANVTPRQLLFLVCMVAVLFICLGGAGWVFEMLNLMSLKISGEETFDPVSQTIYVALLSIVVLVAFYCYYRILAILFDRLVAKDKKLQFGSSMHKTGLPENKPVAKGNQGIPNIFGAIERGGLLSLIVANTVYLLAIIAFW